MTVRITRTARAWLVLAGATALLTAACSSSGTSTSGTSQPVGSSAGSGTQATGSPITLGYYNQVNSPTLNFPEYTVGTQAAVDYINSDLGGVGGHPIQLDTCETAGTPESTQSCAQQLVAKHPVAIVAGVDFNQPAAHGVFGSAGIPQLGSAPLLPPDYTAKDTFYFAPGTPGLLAAEALFAIDVLHAKSVGIIYDAPGIKAGLPFITGPLDKAGVKHLVVDASASSDYTGPFSALRTPQQNAIITAFGSSSGCISFGQAYKAQQSTTPVIGISTCRTPDVLKSAGADQDGWYYTDSGFEDLTSNPSTDGKTMLSAFTKSVHAAPVGLEGSAFEVMMTVYSVLKAIGPEVTSAAVIKYMRTESGQMFGGPAWKCGQAPAFPAVCSFKSRFYQVKGDSVAAADGGQYIDPVPALGG